MLRVQSGGRFGFARPSRPTLPTVELVAQRRTEDVWQQQERRGLTARELIRMAQIVRLRAPTTAM